MQRQNLFLLLIVFILHNLDGFSQINARMFRYPDVSDTHIVFSYAGDVWIAPKSGGTANKLSSSPGEELFAKFSPDGTQVSFTANYDGNRDVYVMPSSGGMPTRLTYHSGFDRLVEWHPGGDKVLFASSRESFRQRFRQLYTVSSLGGLPEKLPMLYGEFGSYSPDGTKMAFNFKSRAFRTWKRYRGGSEPDIWIFDLDNFNAVNITNNSASDEFPMWIGNKVFYLSDQGPNKRYNIWSYDLDSKSSSQITEFTDLDVHFPSAGKTEIVFEAGGRLYLLNTATGNYKEVNIKVVTDQTTITPRIVEVKKLLQAVSISPDGKRLATEARGEVFSVPAENGYTKNLTNSSGVAERYAAWSPDGKTIAYWSDKTGEYQLTLFDLEKGVEKTVTTYADGFRYKIYWSPDSKKLAFADQAMNINYFDLAANSTVNIDKGKFLFQGGLVNFRFSWSADSRWLTYSRGLDNFQSAVFLYDTKNKTRHQVTSGYYADRSPVFDPEGKYLYVITSRNFSPNYSDIQGTFIYSNTSRIAAMTLKKDAKSPLAPKNDEVSPEEDETSEKETDKKKSKKGKDKVPKVEIDLDGLEQRMVILPIGPGNYASIAAVSGKVIYHQRPNTGSIRKNATLHYFDLEKRESKIILDEVGAYQVSADGKKIVVHSKEKIAIVDVAPDRKMDKEVNIHDMKTKLDPKAEWKQLFDDAWRLERDYFYDKNMHGVDWVAMKDQYSQLIDDAVTRWDVNYVLGELIGELNASHTYRGGGQTEKGHNNNVGYLGVDWEIRNGQYQIKKIIRGAAWDVQVRSPLDMPGVEVNVGDYVLAVNGVPLDTSKEPYASFQGLADKTIELMVNNSPSKKGARTVIVRTLKSESRLRHLAWIEANRTQVEKATDGRAGYIYVRSTGIDGQNELVRQFRAQIDKEGLIIDERFNSGGQIPDRFIELLNRKPLAYWAVRDGKDWQWPIAASFGPKAMLINGWSGSGGDAFPDYFRKAGLGPLIGTRTWGGLIGISGAPRLIDGGVVTVPTFRMYDPDGKWFKEGYGVDPDIEVIENPTALANGIDEQLERSILWINEQLKDYKGKPDHETYESR